MVAGAAFADPEADFNLAEVSGNASVTWGVDLDKGTTGFKNETGAKIKLNLVNSGTKSTSGEGIWAELGIKLDNNMVIQADGDGKTSAVADGKIVVDVAKLHFYNFYVGIKSGDTTVGSLELPNAVRSAWGALDAVAGTSHTQGIVLGYGDNKNINFEFDFRSNKAPATPAVPGKTWWFVVGGTTYTTPTWTDNATTIWSDATDAQKAGKTLISGVTVLDTKVVGGTAAGADDYYTNDYGLAAEFKLLDSNEYVNGLFATVGGSFQINEKALGAAASAGYKLALNDTFYVKPVVGWTMDADLSAQKINAMKLAGGLVFGWGDETDANAGVYYLDNDQAKKVIPGVGVNVLVPLNDSDPIIITPSFYSGSIVENLTAAATADISIPRNGGDAGIAVAGGLKYAIAATDSVTVTPQVGARFATADFVGAAKKGGDPAKYTWEVANTDNGGVADNVAAAGDSLLNIKAGLDVAGLINNTTFSVWYQSRNLLQTAGDAKKLGTINVQCKISF